MKEEEQGPARPSSVPLNLVSSMSLLKQDLKCKSAIQTPFNVFDEVTIASWTEIHGFLGWGAFKRRGENSKASNNFYLKSKAIARGKLTFDGRVILHRAV